MATATAPKKAEKPVAVKPPIPPKPPVQAGSKVTPKEVRPAAVKPPAPPKEKEEAAKLPPKPEVVKEEKPAEKPQKKERPVTGVISVPEKRGAGAGKGTSYRARLFGHPVTAIMRACYARGYTIAEVKELCTGLLDPPPQDATYMAQRTALRKGHKDAPNLSEATVTEIVKVLGPPRK